MIDLHHHCLPGVDDGPKVLEDAVAQCRAAAEDGIKVVVATPHRGHPQYDVSAEAARRVHAVLSKRLRDDCIPLDLWLGHEVHWSDGLIPGLLDGTNLRLAGNPKWFLFELPDSHVPVHLERLVFDLQIAGQHPVLAHPERNLELAGDAKRLADLRARGVAVQVTAMSVTGDFGPKAKKAAERWLKEGLVDVLATDAHNTGRRPPRLRAAVDRAAKWIGEEAARRLVQDNPARILKGETLP
jgi:protein-tyrosine phosphatase